MYNMSVISVRVPKEVKDKLRKYGINLSKEIRGFLLKRVEEIEREEALKEILKILEAVPTTEKGYATRSVREDRDR